jgi:hypothetical protein
MGRGRLPLCGRIASDDGNTNSRSLMLIGIGMDIGHTKDSCNIQTSFANFNVLLLCVPRDPTLKLRH